MPKPDELSEFPPMTDIVGGPEQKERFSKALDEEKSAGVKTKVKAKVKKDKPTPKIETVFEVSESNMLKMVKKLMILTGTELSVALRDIADNGGNAEITELVNTKGARARGRIVEICKGL